MELNLASLTPWLFKICWSSSSIFFYNKRRSKTLKLPKTWRVYSDKLVPLVRSAIHTPLWARPRSSWRKSTSSAAQTNLSSKTSVNLHNQSLNDPLAKSLYAICSIIATKNKRICTEIIGYETMKKGKTNKSNRAASRENASKDTSQRKQCFFFQIVVHWIPRIELLSNSHNLSAIMISCLVLQAYI